MIVQADRAALIAGSFCNGFDSFRFSRDACSLVISIARRFASAHDPQLRLKVVPLEHVQDQTCFIVESCGKPPAQQMNVVPLQRFDLSVEAWDMFGTIIIHKMTEPELLE